MRLFKCWETAITSEKIFNKTYKLDFLNYVMDYSKLCETYHALESTTKGLEKTQILADFLELIKNPETIYLLQGKVFAEFNNREMGISHQLAIRAIARAVGIGDKEVLESFKELGDLGKVAEKLLGEQKKQTALFTQKLKIEKVMNSLRRITTLEGTGTVDLKLNLIVDLFHSASPLEAKYIMRTVLSDLKIGVGAGILRDAVVVHCFKPESIEEKKEYVLKVQEAYDKTTDWREVFEKSCSDTLNTIELKPGRPLKVMLFPKAANITDAFRIVGEPAAFEYKYDGFRVMINKDEKGKVKIFTRRLEEVTVQFPEIVDYVTNNVNGKNFIIDGEAVGFDSETKKYTAFQAISQRIRRKYGIESMMKRFPVELVLFDIIYHEGRSLIEVAFEQRRELLKKIVKVEPYKIILSK